MPKIIRISDPRRGRKSTCAPSFRAARYNAKLKAGRDLAMRFHLEGGSPLPPPGKLRVFRGWMESLHAGIFRRGTIRSRGIICRILCTLQPNWDKLILIVAKHAHLSFTSITASFDVSIFAAGWFQNDFSRMWKISDRNGAIITRACMYKCRWKYITLFILSILLFIVCLLRPICLSNENLKWLS